MKPPIFIAHTQQDIPNTDKDQPDTDVAAIDTAVTHPPASSGTTLLPRPVASLVSLLTQSTSLSLRVGTFFGGVALDSARATTLTSLELGRAVIEGILTRAGRDVAIRSGDEHGRMEAESLLERSLATLHTTVTSASFFAAATFHFSSTTLASVANFSQALLSTLDAILGSTESSRAIAAIITLIRREFRSVDANADGEKIGVGDLLIGSVGFALLQRWGKKKSERVLREKGGDEVVWDTVILDNGARADVLGTHQLQFANPSTDCEELPTDPERASFIMPGNDDEAFGAVRRRSSVGDSLAGSRLSIPLDGQHQVSDEDIQSYIMSQLPQGCHASIKSEVLTARTITVDIFDDDTAEIAAPPGTTIVEERFHHDQDYDTSKLSEYQRLPRHTVVFRTAFNKSHSAQLRPQDVPNKLSSPAAERPQPCSPDHASKSRQAKPHPQRSQSYPDSNSPPAAIKRQVSSPDPSSEPSQKQPFGRSSFSKFAQRVKQNGTEKLEPQKRTPPKKPIPRVAGTSGTPTIRPPSKPARGTASVKEATAREAVSRSEPKKRPVDIPNRPTTPAPNRGLPRSPYPGSPQSPRTPARPNPRDAHDHKNPRPGHFAVREKSQECLLTQTDAFSRRRAGELRPGSPATTRHVRSSSSMSLTRSETDGNVSVNDHRPSSSALHRRSQSYTPSMYSVATAGSETSLLLAHRPRKSAYEDIDTIQALNRDGIVPGIFPERHFVQNIRRFCRFSSASYGASALKVMGVPKGGTKSLPQTASDSHEHSAFSDHAGLPPSTILLSSFVDPAGGSNAAGETESGFPLVHYLSIDHDSKAVVLTLRGTWGFEDILTDMTCDYDDLEWQGKNWKVHKGMHASAKRLLEGGGGRVMITLRAALEEFPDYGVVLCGHSLGGGVAALLATMISEPNPAPTPTGTGKGTGTSFVTASYQSTSRPRLLAVDTESSLGATPPTPAQIYTLPNGRPIHVYAYGPPAVMSPFLRLATRGLITTIVNGSDVVPTLSLGILHDMHTVSLSFKSDISGAKSHIRHRLHESLRQSIIHKFYVNQPPLVINAGDGVGEDAWAWRTLNLLRDEMRAPKLMPPGEVFVVETMRVLQRDAFTAAPEFGASDSYPRLGRPATRVQMRFVRDVDAWFGELRFAGGMLSDHNPARYETSLAALARGVLDE